MAKTEFNEIPSLLEKMKITWGNINSLDHGKVKLDKSDLNTVREAFIAASKYEELNKLWQQAYSLFLDKHQWPSGEHQNKTREALRRAAEIMGFITEGRGETYHPQREREIYEDYTWYQVFYFKDNDGKYCNEEGDVFDESELKKQAILEIQKKYNFLTPRAAADHLRDKHAIKEVPTFRDHSKKPS